MEVPLLVAPPDAVSTRASLQPRLVLDEKRLFFSCVALDQPIINAASVVYCALEDLFGASFYSCMDTVFLRRWTVPDPATMRPDELAKARLMYAANAKKLAVLRAKKAANKPFDERRLRRLESFEWEMTMYAPDVRTNE